MAFNIYFSYKELIPDENKSFLAYSFTCFVRSFKYIGEVCPYLQARIEKYNKNDKNSNNYI